MYPEYVQPLRKEFEGPAYDSFEATGEGLPLMDSFLKESSRLSPLDSSKSNGTNDVLNILADNAIYQ